MSVIQKCWRVLEMLKKTHYVILLSFFVVRIFLNLDKIKDKILKSVGALIFGLIVPYPLWSAPFTPLFRRCNPSPRRGSVSICCLHMLLSKLKSHKILVWGKTKSYYQIPYYPFYHQSPPPFFYVLGYFS